MQKLFENKDSQFTEAYSLYYAIVYGSLYSRSGDADDAEDMAQEVFLRFFNKMDEAINVRTWLLFTMKNVLREHLRDAKNMPDDLAEAEANHDIALTFTNGFRDTRIVIDKAIESISDETDRAIFDLMAVQYYTHEETAEVLGITQRRVKYRYGIIISTVLDYLHSQGIQNIEDLFMTDNMKLIEKLFEKYEVAEPLPASVRADIIANRRRNLVRILKRVHRYNPVLGATLVIYFMFKKLGVSVSLTQSAVILFTAGMISVAGVGTGTYVAVKHIN